MKLKKILSTDDPLFFKVKTRVVVKRDADPLDPLHDWDRVFLMHSMIPREFCGNESDKGYVSPLVEIEDEDGYGTGRFAFREGVVAFPVAAYIHSGIAFSLGDGSHFPDQQWDVVRTAAYLWTDKERFEKICCRDGWMTVYDETLKKRRPAKDEAEFREYLRKMAEGELRKLQQTMAGDVWGFVTEERQEYRKVHPDGREEECCEYEDTTDSCWGYYRDENGRLDMGADKSLDGSVEWFTDEQYLVGTEYEVPEFVVTKARPDGDRAYLCAYTKTKDGTTSCEWSLRADKAIRFASWRRVQSVAQDVIPRDKYSCSDNCVEIDKIGRWHDAEVPLPALRGRAEREPDEGLREQPVPAVRQEHRQGDRGRPLLPGDPGNTVFAVDVYVTVCKCVKLEAADAGAAEAEAHKYVEGLRKGRTDAEFVRKLSDEGFQDAEEQEVKASGEADETGEIEYY